MKITHGMLKEQGACASQIRLFNKTFPNGSPANKEEALTLALKHADEFDWDWAADNLLTVPALKAYDEAILPIEKAYNEAIAPALKAYEEAIAPVWRAPVWEAFKAYEKAIAPALKAYNEAIATAFVEVFYSLEGVK